jgi:hypothetical protein
MHLKTSDQENMVPGISDYRCGRGTHICGLYFPENMQ